MNRSRWTPAGRPGAGLGGPQTCQPRLELGLLDGFAGWPLGAASGD